MTTITRVTAALVTILSCAGSALAQEPWGCPTPPGAAPWESLDSLAVAEDSNALPEYPQLFRDAGIGGTVQFGFVVDTTGAVEPGGICVREAPYDVFNRTFFRDWRFTPAVAGGRSTRSEFRLEVTFGAGDTMPSREPATLGNYPGALSVDGDRARLRIGIGQLTYGLVPTGAAPALDSALLVQVYGAALRAARLKDVHVFCVLDESGEWRGWDTARARPAEIVANDCRNPDRHVARIRYDSTNAGNVVFEGGIMRIMVGLHSVDQTYCPPDSFLCARGYDGVIACEVSPAPAGWLVSCRHEGMGVWVS